MIIAALVVGWLLLGACGGALLWFMEEREFYPHSEVYRVRVGDVWMFGFLSLFGPITLLVSCIYIFVTLLGERAEKTDSDNIIFTFKRKVK